METSTRSRITVGRNAAIGIGIIALIAIALAIFLTATNRRKRVTAIATEPTVAAEARIPLIDAEAPAEIETATFALG